MGWLKINIEKNDVLFPKKKFNDKYFTLFTHIMQILSMRENIYGNSYHQNKKFTSIVKKKNIIGTQFHPEKSGHLGLLFLKNLKGYL